jgi:hypothetical protein
MAILALLALRSVWVVYFKYKESLALRNTVQVEVNELSKREKELSSNIQRLGTEEGVESEIRSKFSVSKNRLRRLAIRIPMRTIKSPPRKLGRKLTKRFKKVKIIAVTGSNI